MFKCVRDNLLFFLWTIWNPADWNMMAGILASDHQKQLLKRYSPKYPQMPSIWPSLISKNWNFSSKKLSRRSHAVVRILIFFLGNMPQFVVIRSNSLMVFQFQRNTKRSCSVQICHCSLHTNVILKQHELLVSMHHKDDKNLSILTLFIYIYMQNPTVIIQHTTGSTSLHHLHSQPALPVARRWWTRWAAPGNTEEVWNRSHIKSVLEATPKRGCARTLCLMVKKQVIQTINIYMYCTCKPNTCDMSDILCSKRTFNWWKLKQISEKGMWQNRRLKKLPSRELIYPALGKGTSSTQNAIFWGIC